MEDIIMEDIFEICKRQMPELSLLSLDDIQGENKLEVLDKYGLLAELSALSLANQSNLNSAILLCPEKVRMTI